MREFREGQGVKMREKERKRPKESEWEKDLLRIGIRERGREAPTQHDNVEKRMTETEATQKKGEGHIKRGGKEKDRIAV